MFPDTKPDLYFDSDGVCDACHSAGTKWTELDGVNWLDREREFNSIVDNTHKGALYDCVVPVSGGKDSTWQTYRAIKAHGLHALAVTFDQFDQTAQGTFNLNILKEVGVDHIHFSLNPNIVKLLVKKGLEEVGDPYWVNHVGMFTLPHHIAQRFEIPLVLYGENPQFEYGGPASSRKPKPMDKRWRQEFGGLRGLREEDLIGLDIRERDLNILSFPETGYESLGLFYGDYFRWDPAKHTDEIKKLGWRELDSPQVGSYLKTENIDMEFIDLREHIKYLKFGYGRATDQLNIEIRAGLISRDKALTIVKKIDGLVSETSIRKFADYISVSEDELADIISQFVNKDLFYLDNGKWIPKFIPS